MNMESSLRLFSTSLAIIILSFICVTCKPAEQVSSGIVTFTVGKVSLNGKAVSIGDSVFKNDTIQTGLESMAVVQFGKSALMVLKGESSLKIDSLLLGEKDDVRLFMQYGNSFNKIVKKGSNYFIKTPTIIAAVRGTAFSLIQKKDSDIGRCLVLEGTVTVGKAADAMGPQKAETADIKGGHQVQVSGDMMGAPVALDVAEKKEMVSLDGIRIIDELPDAGAPDRKELIEKNPVMPGSHSDSTDHSGSKNEGDAKTPKQVFQEKLSDIKVRNHGKLDMITLKDGRTLLGMIVERGLVYKIETPYGLQLIQQEEIVTQTIQY